MLAKNPLIFLMRAALVYRAKAILALCASVLNKLCDVVPELLIGLAIDVIVNQQHSFVARVTGMQDPFTQLIAVGVLTATLWIGESFFEYVYLIVWRDIAQSVQRDLRLQAYDHLQRLDLAFLGDKSTGGLLAIVNDDVQQLEQFLSAGPNALIQLSVNIVVIGGIFFLVSPVIAVLTLAPVPFVVGISLYFQQHLARLYEKVRGRAELLAGHLAGRLMGIATIKSYTTENYEVAELKREGDAYYQLVKAVNKVSAAYIPLVRMPILAGFILSMMVGGYYALHGTIAISSFSILVFLTQRFLWPFTELASLTDMYERAMASMKRIGALLALENTIKSGTVPLRNASLSVLTFDNVSFSYPESFPVFEQLSLSIQPQKTTAFVGTTGSGKSTLIKLLLRFYDPTAGTILLAEHSLADFNLEDLRTAIGLVSQEVYLMHGTVADNIAYGSRNASPEEIVAVAKMAEAHDFIMQLPCGYETIVQEGGKNLSGGQRQRISIARALLKRPAILIFDEATAALDNETEAAIARSLATIAGRQTMIIIAHRLSTVRHADVINVMQAGRIVESGTHQQLCQQNGVYAALWRTQTGE